MANMYDPAQDEDTQEVSQQNPLQANQTPLQGSNTSTPKTAQNAANTPAQTNTENLSSGQASNIQAGPQGAPTEQPKRSSGRFTNLQKFIDANKQANIGSQVAGKINTERTNAGTALTGAQNNFTTDLNNTKGNIDTTFGAGNTALTTLGATGKQQAPVQDLNAIQDQITSAKNLDYSGPKDLRDEDLNNLEASQQNLQSMGNATGTEAGRFGLLQQFYNKPTYTQGQQKLDQLFLQADPNAAKALQGAKENALSFTDQLANARAQATGNATNLQSYLDAQKSQLNNNVTTTKNSLSQDLLNRIDAENAARAAAAKDVTLSEARQSLDGTPGVTLSRATPSGLSTGDSDYMVNIAPGVSLKLSQLIKSGAIQGNVGNEATETNYDPEAQARLNILRGLTGDTQTAFGQVQDAGITNTADAFKTNVNQLKTSLAQSQYGDLTKPVAFDSTFANTPMAKAPDLQAMQHVIDNKDAFITGAGAKANPGDMNLAKQFLTPDEAKLFDSASGSPYTMGPNGMPVLKSPELLALGRDQYGIYDPSTARANLARLAAQRAEQNYDAAQKAAKRNAIINSFTGRYQ